MIANDNVGTHNLFDRENAWTDASGAIHRQIKKKSDRSWCAEILLNRSLGYGTYLVAVRDTSHLESAATFSIVTFEEWGDDQRYSEMDVEVRRWGDATNKNKAQYIIQPFYNRSKFAERGGARRIVALVSLLLIARRTSDRDGVR
jgi:hypothetical protein